MERLKLYLLEPLVSAKPTINISLLSPLSFSTISSNFFASADNHEKRIKALEERPMPTPKEEKWQLEEVGVVQFGVGKVNIKSAEAKKLDGRIREDLEVHLEEDHIRVCVLRKKNGEVEKSPLPLVL